MKNIAIAILLLILLLVTPVSAGIQGARGFEKTVLDATFALYGSRIDKTTLKLYQPFLCTAFVFQKDATGYLLLSAGHCVDDTPIDATFGVAEQMGGTIQLVTVVSARLKASDDYAIFHLDTSKIYPVLTLGDESTEYVGSAELNPNFAYGIVKQLAHGVISSQIIDKPAPHSDCSLCVGYFALQSFAGGGASGSPVISVTTHKVIGVLVLTLEGSGFGVEPISLVKEAETRPDMQTELHKLHLDNEDESN